MKQGLIGTLLVLIASTAVAQDAERTFGFEFEFAGKGNYIFDFDRMPFENYERILRVIVEHYGGNPADIERVDFMKPTPNLERWPSGERALFSAKWVDPQGRTWTIDPEYVVSRGLDGYELVTPPLRDTAELRTILEKVGQSDLVREGLKSGVHLTIDGKGLVKPNGDARALVNLIALHENFEPMLRRLFNPIRGGGFENRFSRSLSVDFPDLMRAIDALPADQRTTEKLEELFRAREGQEARVHDVDPMDPNQSSKIWKYRALNLAKILNINPAHDANKRVVEFRMFDLHALENPEVHVLEAEFYRAMVKKAIAMAEAGETVRFEARASQPAGEDPSIFNTPEDPEEARAKAREMLERMGLDPAKFEALLGQNFQHRFLPTASEFEGMLGRLGGGRVVHEGKAFTYGFELEGTGEGFALLLKPKAGKDRAKDLERRIESGQNWMEAEELEQLKSQLEQLRGQQSELNERVERWETLSDGQKKEYYRKVIGQDRRAVPEYFDLDTQKFEYLDKSWKVEGTGNWEIRSKPFESIEEAAEMMREVKRLTGVSGKGFHLHMRDNNPNKDMLKQRASEFADFIERSANWIWLERVMRLGTMTSLKSWSNSRMQQHDVNNLAQLQSSSRATVRVTFPWDSDYVDLEIRGLTKWVDDIERLGKIYTEAMRTGNFGPWKHDANPMPSNARGEAPESLQLVDHFTRYLKEVEGKEITPEMRRVIDALQNEYIHEAKGEARSYQTNVATPLLPWHLEEALSEPLRRTLKHKQEEFLRSLRFTADKVMNGEYGLDLSVASAEALVRLLGLTEAEAEAIRAHRAAGGAIQSAEDLVRVLALGADAIGAQRLEDVELEKAGKEALMERLGLTETEAKNLIDFREAHEIEEALAREGNLSQEEISRIVEQARGLDLSQSDATAERIVQVTELPLKVAQKIVAYREANTVDTEEALRKAGLTAEQARDALARAGEEVNLRTAEAEDLRRLGLSDAEVQKLLKAQEGVSFNTYKDLKNVGLTAAQIKKIKANGELTIEKLNTLSSEALVRAGVAPGVAKKIEGARPKHISNVEVLQELLGQQRGQAIYEKAHAVDLARANVNQLRFAGLSEAIAEKIVNYRDAHKIGRGQWSSYFDGEDAAKELKSAGILTEAQAKKVALAVTELYLDSMEAEALAERFGLSKEAAKRVVLFRDFHDMDAESLKEAGLTAARAKKLMSLAEGLDAAEATIEKIMERTGLTQASAKLLKKLAALNPAEASAAELKRAGIPAEVADRIVELRTALAAAPGLDFDEITRQMRFKVKNWSKETNVAEEMLRSLLPRANPNDVRVVPPHPNPESAQTQTASNTQQETTESRPGAEEVEFFNRARVVGDGLPVAASKMSVETVSQVFEGIRQGALDLNMARRAEVSVSELAVLDGNAERLNTLKLEIVETNTILAEHAPGKVRISTGLLNEVYLQAETVAPEGRGVERMRLLGLFFGHEVAHETGIRSERVVDGEALRIFEVSTLGASGPVTRAEMKATLEVFNKPTGASHLDNLVNRMRNLLRYGTTAGRVEAMERAVNGQPDPLAKFRRADGTLKMPAYLASRAKAEGIGTAHFALALFLKEIALVARTGDRARIEEFFDSLLTTDFYVQYGLFIAGARMGEIAYNRYLTRFVKPGFVTGLMKTNLVLAAGVALPMIVSGQFEAGAYAISLGSLGLSVTAVKSGVAGIKWVTTIEKAKQEGKLVKMAGNAGRLARFGGWFYTAAELAVILYFAEVVEHQVSAFVKQEQAKAAIADAGKAFSRAVNDPNADEASVRAAAAEYASAWAGYRDSLYAPLEEDAYFFQSRMAKAARHAKENADERNATLERVMQYDALRANVESRYGSVEAYAEHLLAEEDAKLDEQVNTYVESFNISREKHLKEVYLDNMREGSLLAGITDDDLAGSRRLEDAFKHPSKNRMQAYDDEADVLRAYAERLKAKGEDELAQVLLDALVDNQVMQAADEMIIRSGVLNDAEQQQLTDLVRGGGPDAEAREGAIDRIINAAGHITGE